MLKLWQSNHKLWVKTAETLLFKSHWMVPASWDSFLAARHWGVKVNCALQSVGIRIVKELLGPLLIWIPQKLSLNHPVSSFEDLVTDTFFLLFLLCRLLMSGVISSRENQKCTTVFWPPSQVCNLSPLPRAFSYKETGHSFSFCQACHLSWFSLMVCSFLLLKHLLGVSQTHM